MNDNFTIRSSLEKPNLEIGDIVIISDPRSPRGHWPMGRIIKVHPDAEGVVRSAVVKTKSGVLARPITKLCLLESPSSSENRADASSRNPDLDSASASRIGGKNVRNWTHALAGPGAHVESCPHVFVCRRLPVPMYKCFACDEALWRSSGLPSSYRAHLSESSVVFTSNTLSTFNQLRFLVI